MTFVYIFSNIVHIKPHIFQFFVHLFRSLLIASQYPEVEPPPHPVCTIKQISIQISFSEMIYDGGSRRSIGPQIYTWQDK